MNSTKPRELLVAASGRRGAVMQNNRRVSASTLKAASIERPGGDPSVTTDIMQRSANRRRAQQTHPGKRGRGARW